MPFKVILDGADKGVKFGTKEEAIESMWEIYKDKMSRPEFEAFITPKIEQV